MQGRHGIASERNPSLSCMVWSKRRVPEAAQTAPYAGPHHQPTAGPPPLLLFICLITKQKLQSGLLYFCM